MDYDPNNPTSMLPATGQPAALADGEWEPSSKRPRLFGQGYRELVGVPKVVIVTQPAAGAEWRYTHSGPSWYLVRNVIAQLVASAVVATRVARLQLLYQSVLSVQMPPTATQTAGLTIVYNTTTAGTTTADASTSQWPLPDDLILKDGMVLQSNTTAIQTGDQWSLIALLVEEFTDKCLDVY